MVSAYDDFLFWCIVVTGSMPTEEDIDHTKFIIFTAITTILIVIAVLGFVLGLCWYM